jgi:hypothetical protein
MPFYMNTKLLATIAGIAIVVAIIAVAIFKKLRIALYAFAVKVKWKSFLRGQGTILSAFLFFGAALGWVSIRFFGENTSQTKDQIQLVEYRQLNIAAQPVYEYLDSGGYTQLTVYAKATAPQASKVSIRVIAEDEKPGTQGSIVFQGTDTAWSRLDEKISTQHLTLIIGDSGTGTTKATQADVLVFLGKQ